MHRRSNSYFNRAPRDIGDLDFVERIGAGHFGEVWKVRSKWTGELMAAKRAKRTTTLSKLEFLKEAKILRTLRHDNLLHLLAVLVVNDPSDSPSSPNEQAQNTTLPPGGPGMYLITEFCDGGDVAGLLSNKEVPLPWPQRVRYALDIARGLRYLHDNYIIHRDLKCENCLLYDPSSPSNRRPSVLEKQGTAKRNSRRKLTKSKSIAESSDALLSEPSWNRVVLADFGLARWYATEDHREVEAARMTICGTPWSMAPELLEMKSTEGYSLSSDIFSLGIVLAEIVTRRRASDLPRLDDFGVDMDEVTRLITPFEQMNPHDETNNVDEYVRFKAGFIQLVKRCCKLVPSERPTAIEVVEEIEDMILRIITAKPKLNNAPERELRMSLQLFNDLDAIREEARELVDGGFSPTSSMVFDPKKKNDRIRAALGISDDDDETHDEHEKHNRFQPYILDEHEMARPFSSSTVEYDGDVRSSRNHTNYVEYDNESNESDAGEPFNDTLEAAIRSSVRQLAPQDEAPFLLSAVEEMILPFDLSLEQVQAIRSQARSILDERESLPSAQQPLSKRVSKFVAGSLRRLSSSSRRSQTSTGSDTFSRVSEETEASLAPGRPSGAIMWSGVTSKHTSFNSSTVGAIQDRLPRSQLFSIDMELELLREQARMYAERRQMLRRNPEAHYRQSPESLLRTLESGNEVVFGNHAADPGTTKEHKPRKGGRRRLSGFRQKPNKGPGGETTTTTNPMFVEAMEKYGSRAPQSKQGQPDSRGHRAIDPQSTDPRRHQGTDPRRHQDPRGHQGTGPRRHQDPRGHQGTDPRRHQDPRGHQGTDPRRHQDPRGHQGTDPRRRQDHRGHQGTDPRRRQDPQRHQVTDPRRHQGTDPRRVQGKPQRASLRQPLISQDTDIRRQQGTNPRRQQEVPRQNPRRRDLGPSRKVRDPSNNSNVSPAL